MTAPPRRLGQTFRLEQVPQGSSPEHVVAAFVEQERDKVSVQSLAPAVDDPSTLTATIYYTGNSKKEDLLDPLSEHEFEIDATFNGFTPLNTPTEPVIADVVAIAGPSDHAFDIWARSGKRMWLRDYLPKDLPSVRILTFGYKTLATIEDCAQRVKSGLLNMQAGSDHDSPARPIIFVAYGLGGLVLRKVLADVEQLPDRGYLQNTSAIIFLGSPNNGVPTDMAPKFFWNGASWSVVDSLVTGSTFLQSLQKDFLPVCPRLQILSCYEGQVDDSTAEPLVPLESASLEAPFHELVESEQSHEDLAKLERGQASIYSALRGFIRRTVGSRIRSPSTTTEQPTTPNTVAEIQDASPVTSSVGPSKPAIVAQSPALQDIPFPLPAGVQLSPQIIPRAEAHELPVNRTRTIRGAHGYVTPPPEPSPLNLSPAMQNNRPVSTPSTASATHVADSDKQVVDSQPDANLPEPAIPVTRYPVAPRQQNRPESQPEMRTESRPHSLRSSVASSLHYNGHRRESQQSSGSRPLSGMSDGLEVAHLPEDPFSRHVGKEVASVHSPSLHPARPYVARQDSHSSNSTISPAPGSPETKSRTFSWSGLRRASHTSGSSKPESKDFISAARINDVQTMRSMIQQGVDKNATGGSAERNTALHVAAGKGHSEAVQLLIDARADKDKKNVKGHTPLHEASRTGRLDVCLRLLAGGVDVNQRSFEDETPLHLAAQGGHLLVVQALIKNKANVNATRFGGVYPLEDAAGRRHRDVERELEAAGARRRTRREREDQERAPVVFPGLF